MNTLPHRNELMKQTVEAIKALGGSGSVDEIVEKVITLLGIPDELVTRPYITKRDIRSSYKFIWNSKQSNHLFNDFIHRTRTAKCFNGFDSLLH